MNGSVLKIQPPPCFSPAPRSGSPTQSQPQPPEGKNWYTSWWLWQASPNWRRLFAHLIRFAASRTFCTAGSSSPISTAMMAITTNNSISVKPVARRHGRRFSAHQNAQDEEHDPCMGSPPKEKNEKQPAPDP